MDEGLPTLTPELEGSGHSDVPVRRQTAIQGRGWPHATASRRDPGAERTMWGPPELEVEVGVDVGDGGCDGLGEEVAMTVSHMEPVSPQVFFTHQGRSKTGAA